MDLHQNARLTFRCREALGGWPILSRFVLPQKGMPHPFRKKGLPHPFRFSRVGSAAQPQRVICKGWASPPPALFFEYSYSSHFSQNRGEIDWIRAKARCKLR